MCVSLEETRRLVLKKLAPIVALAGALLIAMTSVFAADKAVTANLKYLFPSATSFSDAEGKPPVF